MTGFLVLGLLLVVAMRRRGRRRAAGSPVVPGLQLPPVDDRLPVYRRDPFTGGRDRGSL